MYYFCSINRVNKLPSGRYELNISKILQDETHIEIFATLGEASMRRLLTFYDVDSAEKISESPIKNVDVAILPKGDPYDCKMSLQFKLKLNGFFIDSNEDNYVSLPESVLVKKLSMKAKNIYGLCLETIDDVLFEFVLCQEELDVLNRLFEFDPKSRFWKKQVTLNIDENKDIYVMVSVDVKDVTVKYD
ncbi:MAG: hypothetical protein HFJ45_09865 [Clostridia bacterium]|nr:hypothetical protein [Clostridia bacterium]